MKKYLSQIKKRNYLCTLLVALYATSGCSSKAIILKKDENKVTQQGITLSAGKIVNKKNKYFVDLVLVNDSEKTVVFKLKKAQCYRGTATGEFKRAFWNAGMKTFQFEPHQRKAFRAVCEHDESESNDFTIKFPFFWGAASDDAEGEHAKNSSSIEWKYSIKKDE